MNGAESLVSTLVGAGVTTCFSNPGTSEMHFVAATDKVDGMHTFFVSSKALRLALPMAMDA